MAETLAVLIVRSGRAQFRHFQVELRGDTVWMTGLEELAGRLRRSVARGLGPELVAVAGDNGDAAHALADELKRRDVATVVLALPPARTPEEQLRLLMRAAVEQGLISSLTGLRNTDALRAEAERRLARGEHFAFLQIDLDNFKAYNDQYHLLRGDEAIRAVAEILTQAVTECGAPGDLVAHIGGDDFAIVTARADEPGWERLVRCIFAKRREQLPLLYDETDRSRGYIEAQDRQRQLRRYPLMTLSIGLVSTRTRRITEYAQLMDYAGQCKEQAKLMEGDFCFPDRRHDDGVTEKPAG